MLARLPEGMREMVEADPSLMEMAWSTVVQHGGGGARKILSGVWQEGMSRDELITSVYASRGRPENFQSSTPETRAAVARRFREEAEVIRNYKAPRHVLDSKVQASLLARAEALERQKQAGNQDELRNAVANYVAASEDGHVLDYPVTQAQLVRAFGDFQGGQLWNDVVESRELALDLSMLSNMTPLARANLLSERQPDPLAPTYRQDANRHARLTNAVSQLEKRFAEDPAGTILGIDKQAMEARANFLTRITPETARKYLATMRGAMASRGVSGPCLSREDSQLLARTFEQAEDPVAFAENLQASFGRDYPEVVSAISPSLSPLFYIIASGIDPTAGRLLVAANRDKNFEKESKDLLALRGTDGTEFDESIAEMFQTFNQSYLSGNNSETPLAMRKAVTDLALQYLRLEGPATKPARAINRAYKELVEDHYQLLEHNGLFSARKPPCRLPKRLYPGGPELDGEEVRMGLTEALMEIDINKVLVQRRPDFDPGLEAEGLANLLRRQAWWVTDTDEKGAVLYLDGNAVRMSDGKPLRISWQEAVAKGRAARARNIQEARVSETGGNFPSVE